MSKITNDGLTRSGTGCFIIVPIMATAGVKGLTDLCIQSYPNQVCIEDIELCGVIGRFIFSRTWSIIARCDL